MVLCDLSSYSESEETINCKWSESPTDAVELIECKSYKGKDPSLCIVVYTSPLLLGLVAMKTQMMVL